MIFNMQVYIEYMIDYTYFIYYYNNIFFEEIGGAKSLLEYIKTNGSLTGNNQEMKKVKKKIAKITHKLRAIDL